LTLIHAPNESVDPNQIERCALPEALFLKNFATHIDRLRWGGRRP